MIFIENEKKSRNCPICGSINKTSLSKKKVWVSAGVKHSAVVNSSECENCKMKYQNPVLSEEQMENFYSNYYVGDSSAQEWRYNENLLTRKESATWFIKYLNKINNKSFAEVGCSSGYNIENINKSATFKSVIGFDLDKASIEYGKERGNNIVDTNFFDSDSKYDVVFLSHVLEHIVNPVEFIISIMNKLNRDGSIVINVPDSYAWYEDPYYEHVNYFSVNSLRKIALKAGLNIISIERSIIHKTEHRVPEIRILLTKSKVEETIDKSDIVYPNKFIREWARNAYDSSVRGSEHKKHAETYKKHKKGRTIKEWLLWSKLYRLFTLKWIVNTTKI